MAEANDLFVRAARERFRFPSVRGELTTEQLWDLPLLAKHRVAVGPGAAQAFDLDTVARGLNNQLKELGEESFVEAANPRRAVVAAMLEVVKVVIAAKQADAKAAERKAERANERRLILDALADQKQRKLSAASEEELLKRLEALDAAG